MRKYKDVNNDFNGGKYIICRFFIVLSISTIMVFLSAGAVFGVNNRNDASLLSELQDNITQNSSQATLIEEDFEDNLTQTDNAENDRNTDPVDYIANPNANDYFTITWNDTVKSGGVARSSTSNVHYGYIQENATGEKTFVSFNQPFQTEDITIDFTNTKLDMDVDAERPEYIDKKVFCSVFDIRYFEETFTDLDGLTTNEAGSTWAYCDCYFGAPTDEKAIHISKIGAHWSATNSRVDWYYRNDLIAGSRASVITPSSLPASKDIYVIYKNAYSDFFSGTSMLDLVDNRINWDSNLEDTNPQCLVQYLYANGDPEAGATIKKMDPPFAGNLTVAANGEINGKNYCGRSVDTHDRNATTGALTGEIYTCVYSNIYINWIQYESGVPGPSSAFVAAAAFWYDDTDNCWKYRKPDDASDVSRVLTYGEGIPCRATEHSYLIASFMYDSSLGVNTENFKSKREEGVDTISKGVTIDVYDYDAFYDNSEQYFYGQINWDHDKNIKRNFNFGSGGTSDWGNWGLSLNNGYDINYWYWRSDNQTGLKDRDDVNNPYIWENKLSDNGYPILRRSQRTNYSQQTDKNTYLSFLPKPPTNSLNESLDYLWGGTNNPYVRQFKNLNYLFSKTEYDSSGYYLFDSAKWFAQLRKKRDATTTENATNGFGSERNNFVLYSDFEGTENADAQFMPFDDKNDKDYSGKNYSFGMHIQSDFIMPEGGKVVHEGTTSNMTFEFTGDDDEFVYIDGALCMDLGGIHGKISGVINFADGTVTQNWANTNDADTKVEITQTLFDLYADAGIIDKDDKSSWSKYFICYEGTEGTENAKYRYIDYSRHILKFYYMERGAGGSNCMIKFNLQTMPEAPITVEKHIDKSTISDNITYEGNFYYRAEVDRVSTPEEDWEIFGLNPITSGGADYPKYDVYEYQGGSPVLIRENVEVSRDPSSSDYGLFCLKDNQYAVLKGYSIDDKFRVVEYDPQKTINGKDDQYQDYNILWDVDVLQPGSTTYTDAQEIKLSNDEIWYGTDKLVIGSPATNKVIFKNTPQTDSFIDLRVEKKGDTPDESDIYIGFNGSGFSSFNPETKRDDSSALSKNYEVFNLAGESQGVITPVNGIITLKNGEYAVIEDVQMLTQVTAIVEQPAETLTDQKYQTLEWDGVSNWIPGLMINPYPAAETKYSPDTPNTLYYSAQVPTVNFSTSTLDADKYSQINFWVKSNTPVPTSLTILKYPELWMFLLATILVLLLMGPIALIRKYFLVKKSSNLSQYFSPLNLHTTFFDI